MSLRCHPDLVRLADGAEVDSPESFAILGQRFEPGADQLLPVLESELYQQLYCGGTEPRTVQSEDPAEAMAFVGALARANMGTGTWEPGWIVGETEGLRGGTEQGGAFVAAMREGITFRVERSQLRTPSGTANPGEECEVRIGKEMRHLLFGFYMALGNTHPGSGGGAGSGATAGGGAAGGTPAPLLRLYWHLTPEAAIRYLEETTGRLNGAGIPFQTKVVANPRQYLRRDSGVLYLRRADFDRTAPILRAIYETIRADLQPDVPLFTKPLAPGLSLAEDPGNKMSFGQSRCRTAALALLKCHREGLTTPELRIDAIAAEFQAGGIDPERPYLASGAADPYRLDPDSATGGE